MSGICAVWQKSDPTRVPRAISASVKGLSLRDSESCHTLMDGEVGVGVSAVWSRQQIYSDSRVLVVCDADPCDRADLWKHCPANRHTASAANGTALLIASLYERFGCDFVARLRGGFSVIVWDRRNRTLLAAIDGFGINRLVYYEDPSVLLVSTRIESLVRTGQLAVEVNPRAIANVLNFTVNLGPETALANVRRLLPGNVLIAASNHTSARSYWDMQYGQVDASSERRLCEELESVVEQSVADHCNDIPPAASGAFLSGGTDSSTVVGMMGRAGHQPVNAFSIGFREHQFDELEYARIAARAFGAEHYTHLVGPEDCFNALPTIIRAYDEPFANSSAIGTYLCAALAAEHGVTVLLAGDGGDELFGGNERYLTDKVFSIYHNVPRFLRRGLIEPALALLPKRIPLVEKGRKYVQRANMPGIDRFFSYHFLSAHEPTDVFEPGFLAAMDEYSVLDAPRRYYLEAPAADHLDRLLYVDVKITLGDSDLPKVTCGSEMAGVQTRFPFLERSVAEFSGRIPATLKVKGFDKRYLFKRAFRNLLPPEVIRKRKHGFGVPVSRWLKSEARLRELTLDTLLSNRAFERGYFRRTFLDDLLVRYQADQSTYYGDMVWTVLMLELWHRQHVDQAAAVTA